LASAPRTVIPAALALAMLALAMLAITACSSRGPQALDSIRSDILAENLGFADVTVSATSMSEGLGGWYVVVNLSIPQASSVSSEQLAAVVTAALPHLDGYAGLWVAANYTGGDSPFVNLEPAYVTLGFAPAGEGLDRYSLHTTQREAARVLGLEQ